MDLKDKIAIITGGASGLGEATVRRFADHGAKCAIFNSQCDAFYRSGRMRDPRDTRKICGFLL